MSEQWNPFKRDLPMDARPKVRYWLPAAAVDEADLCAELQALAARGFGGVEVVVLSTLPPEVAKSDLGWGTPAWEHMMDVLQTEAQCLGLSVDLAIGPGWPIAAPGIDSPDHPAALQELTYGVCYAESGVIFDAPLPQRRMVRPVGTPSLVHVLAYQEAEPGVLLEGSYLDMTPYLNEDKTRLHAALPMGSGARWVIFAFYAQPAGQTVNAGQTYVIDHLSRAGVEAMADYWRPILEQSHPALESLFCDSMEYALTLEWTPEMLQEFAVRRGYDLLPWLPFIGRSDSFPTGDVPGYHLDKKELSDQVNRDYSEVLTQCYCENHLRPLTEFAAQYGKTIRYQVAYNKPFEADRSALCVPIPENEALGRATVDYQKIMAAAAHIGQKQRYSFECAAEFGHSYGQSYEDLFWWVKRSAMAGMNAQVLHGASYSGSCKGAMPICWPGYEGFGQIVSNNWNRTLDEHHARGCLDAITRLNTIFRKPAQVDCAIFRPNQSNDGTGSEFCLYPDGGALSSHGYSYEFLSEALVALAAEDMTGCCLDGSNTAYRCLVVPPQEAITCSMLEWLPRLVDAGLPVLWVGTKPKYAYFRQEWATPEAQQKWHSALDIAWSKIHHADRLEDVPKCLEQLGIRPRVHLDGVMDAITAAHRDGSGQYYAIYGCNRAIWSPNIPGTNGFVDSSSYKKGTIKGTYARPGLPSRKNLAVSLEGSGSVWALDVWSGGARPLDFVPDGHGRLVGNVELEEDELVLLALSPAPAEVKPARKETFHPIWHSLDLYTFGPNAPEEASFLRSGFSDACRTLALNGLKPWRALADDLDTFVGKGVYHGTIALPRTPSGRCILHLGDVCDTFTLCVNGTAAPFPDQVQKQADVTGLLHAGENTLEVTVVSNLYNRLADKTATLYGVPLPYFPRDYGLWETESKPIFLSIES